MSDLNIIWKTDSLPFYWGPLQSPTNGSDLPDTLPFSLYVNPETGVLMQAPDKNVSYALEKAYAKGSSISGMMDDSGIGKEYAEDFLDFIVQKIGRSNLKEKKILEIGCGTGYLLSRLKELGANVLGVEPGSHGQIGASKFDVPIIHDYFPSREIQGEFDLVILYAVLEHLENPYQFINDVKKYVKSDGFICLSVPDVEPYLRKGDASILLHEHWSYFTEMSLSRLLSISIGGCEVVSSNFGGALYASSIQQDRFLVGKKEGIKCEALANEFVSNIESTNKKLGCFISNQLKQGLIVGIYAPIRAINALSIIGQDLKKVRFFDDNKELHGTFFPGFKQSVERKDALLQDQVDVVLIMSFTFGNKIKKSLQKYLPEEVEIITIQNLLSKAY